MDTILVFNFGGQYCHLIARRIREKGVYSEIVQSNMPANKLNALAKKSDVKGIILSGGPSSIYENGAPKMDRKILDSGLPVLGICYGHQLMASYIGGKVSRAEKEEYGTSYANIRNAAGVLLGLGKKEEVWMSHGDVVLQMPKNIDVLADTANCKIAAFMDRKRRLFGVQWHPEVVHTKNGDKILDNFIFNVCKCRSMWKAESTIPDYQKQISEEIGEESAIIALSGGVDSSTAALLASRAIGDKLTAVFVDTGMMREKEADSIRSMGEKMGINLVVIDAGNEFIRKLKGVSDPEKKRKIIGGAFIRVFEREAEKRGAKYLIQGTIYPDRIESGQAKESSVIKTHHNVGGLPPKVKFKGIIEPLKDLYKDEVRKIAGELGLPEEMISRQPFPGPGLAVRIIGEVTKHKLKVLRKAEAIVSEEIERAGSGIRPWQYFAVLADTKSTGVKGDSRAYGNVIAVRAVESKEAMTANFAQIPYSVLEMISSRITSEIPEVVRVVYDITNKPPSTIEWE
jgi:GMP synthase (glutamine-hydrolysing)